MDLYLVTGENRYESDIIPENFASKREKITKMMRGMGFEPKNSCETRP